MKNLKFKKIQRFLVLLFLFSLFTFISALSYVNAVSEDIADSVFRLHVIANSDSEQDQNLKLKVRDALLQYMNKLSADCHDKQEVMNLARTQEGKLKEIALQVIHENGYNYDVSIEVGLSEFPTKTYGDISLPAGTYDALRVKIGEASGKNWWCVMFPPLCFVDVSSGIVPDSSKDEMKNNLSDEEYALISNQDDNQITFKFKLIELFQNFKNLAWNQ